MQSGYAFLHFALTTEDLRSAITAVDDGNILVVEGITYQCKVTRSLQSQLMSTQLKKGKKLGKTNLHPSLTHAFNDCTFETYNAPAPNVFSKSLTPSTMSKYRETNFPSYRKNSAITSSHYESVSPQFLSLSLHDLHSIEANKTPTLHSNRIITTENTADLIYPSFTAYCGTTTASPTMSSNIPNDRHHLSVCCLYVVP